MVTWEEKLRAWGYPRYRELARVLRRLGFRPEDFKTPAELAKALSETARTYGLTEDILNIIKDFLQWFLNTIKPYIGDFILIFAGAAITSWAKGWIKIAGIVPIALGIWDLAKRLGVV